VHLMVKHRKRKFNMRKVKLASSSSIGALAAADVVSNPITNALTDKLRFISVDATYTLSDAVTADDGHSFGLAHSDYTAAEVEECLEAGGSLDLGNKVAQEQANRLVREIGTFGSVPVTTGGLMFNDGKPVKTRLNWLMSEGDTLNLWIRNGSGAVYTTGSAILINGNLWVKD